MSEYDDYLAKYGAPTSAADPTGFSNSLALMEGDRILGNNIHGKGLGDRARAVVAAAQPRGPVVDPAASLRAQALKQAQEQYQAALDANTANEEDIKQGYKSRRERALATLGKISNNATDEINRRFDNLASSARNQANASGIGQTSILTTTLQGIERERAKALAAAGDVKAQREVGYDTQLAGDELAFKERVQNNYPNVGNLLEIAKLEGKGSQQGIDPNAFGGGIGGFGGAPMMVGGGYGIDPFSFGFNWNGGGGGMATAAAKSRPLPLANQSAPAAAAAQSSRMSEPQGWVNTPAATPLVAAAPQTANGSGAPAGGGGVGAKPATPAYVPPPGYPADWDPFAPVGAGFNNDYFGEFPNQFL